MICKNCGQEINDDALFCEKCGTAVEGAASAAAFASQATEQPAPPVPPRSSEPFSQTAPYGQTPFTNDSTAPFEQPAQATGQAAPYGQPAQPASPYAQPPAPGAQATDLGTTPLVLGILSIVFALSMGWLIIGAIAGIVLGILAISKGGKVLAIEPANGKAKGGKITGIVGLILSILTLVGIIIATVFLGMAVSTAVNNPDIFMEEMEKIAALDETGEAQKQIDELKQELDGLGVGGSASSLESGTASSAEPVDYTGGQAFDSWAAECTAEGDQPTLYALTELKGWQMETLLQQLGYVWHPEINTWLRESDDSGYGMIDAYGVLGDLEIAKGDKGGAGLDAYHILVVGSFGSAREALSKMGQVVTDDAMFADDDQSALAVVHGPSMAEYLVLIAPNEDYGTGHYSFFVFPEEACASGLFDEYFDGSDAGTSIDEIWNNITGGAVGDYISAQ